jgi:predicted nucleotidyltransferase
MDVLKNPRLREMVKTARRENRRKERRIRERERRARAFLPDLVQAFRAIDPDIGAIVLFGSLAEGAVRSEHFDIDIAVRSAKYLKLVAWALNQGFRIDVVDIDGAPPHIAERIRAMGEVLYAGKKGL